jgi:hypothetical protein
MDRKNSQQQDHNIPDHGRRNFIKNVGLGALSLPLSSYMNLAAQNIAIVINTNDAVAMSKPAQWAVSELISTLTNRGAMLNGIVM